jgi:hypothetical protein
MMIIMYIYYNVCNSTTPTCSDDNDNKMIMMIIMYIYYVLCHSTHTYQQCLAMRRDQLGLRRGTQLRGISGFNRCVFT